MSNEDAGTQVVPETTETSTPQKQVWTRNDVKQGLLIAVHLPFLYANYEPWVFNMRIKLSEDAEERRQEYLSLAASEQTVKFPQQALDEVCDLLKSLPTGFGDLKDNGKGPGPSFRSYIETTVDPEAKDLLYKIAIGASNLYWMHVTPREFRKQVPGSVS
jgi:hypothetical protein